MPNLVKDENGDPFAHSHNILNRWKNEVIPTAQLLLSDPSLLRLKLILQS
jgi:hypothetical protein